MAYYSEDLIDEILASTDIVEVVNDILESSNYDILK